MKITSEKDILKMIATEDLQINHVQALQADMLKAMQKFKGKMVVLDLTQINHMDSMGVKLVIGLYKSCEENNISLRVEVSSPSILQLFKICKLNQFLDICEVVS